MLLETFNIGPDEVRCASGLFVEIKQRQKAPRLGKGKYPQTGFDYSRYQNDPRPNVLVLGSYKHPNTHNDLLCGINLNYLSSGQIEQLRKATKRIYNRDTTKSRWRYLDKILPDIARHAYRTYDKRYIRAIEPDEFLGVGAKLEKPTKTAAKPTPTLDVPAEPSTKDAQTSIKKMEVHPEPEKSDDKIDTARSLWQLKQRLYDPETGKRQKPERPKIKGATKAKREKLNRYRSQRKKLKDLEQQAQDAEQDDELDREQDPYGDLEWADELPHPDEFNQIESVNRPYYTPELGFVWNSPKQYKAYHTTEGFKNIKHLCPGKPIAVHDTISGITLVDTVPDHSYILEYANWDYDHTILLEYGDNNITIRSNDNNCILTLEDIDIGVIRLLTEQSKLL